VTQVALRGGQAATAFLLAASAITRQPFAAVMTWLCLTGFDASFWPSPFWALPTLTLTASAAALINMCANLAGWIGNYQMGWLRSHGYSERQCLVLLGSCYLVGAVLASFVRIQRPSSRQS